MSPCGRADGQRKTIPLRLRDVEHFYNVVMEIGVALFIARRMVKVVFIRPARQDACGLVIKYLCSKGSNYFKCTASMLCFFQESLAANRRRDSDNQLI